MYKRTVLTFNQDNGYWHFNLQIIDLETDEVPKEQNLQEALRLKRPDYIARTKVYGTNQSLITCLQI